MDIPGPGHGGLLDPDGAAERLMAWKGSIDRLAADTKAMSERLQDLQVTASDDNHLVTVVIDSSGVLVDLALGQRIQRVAPDVVARTIMNTIRRAKAQIADRSREIIEETIGTESEPARAIAARVERQLRGPDLDSAHADRRDC